MKNTRSKKIELGYSDFNQFIKAGNYFVDKSMLIYELFEQGAYISLMPRPKRFGKTLNLSMIEHFFDIQKPDSKDLFSDYEISQKTEFCKEHQNKYPVINITLKDIDEKNWDDCLDMLKITISELYKKHDFLLKSKNLKTYDKQIFEQIILRKATNADYKLSLQNLSEYLQKHFDQKVIILVDEYDAPIINAFQNTPKPIKSEKGNTTYYENIINFMQTFLGKAFKGNDTYLRKGLLTGVMRVGRESIFSKWNNFDVYSITMPYFADKFGFTQEETDKLLTYFNLQNKKKHIAQWYDGYKFGNTRNIYNPWSIVSYVAKNEAGFRPYWANTGSDSLIRDKILEPDVDKTYKTIQKLISGEVVTKEIEENFVFADFETDKDLLWTLLVYSGYLTQVRNIELETYELKIPNFEIEGIFKKIIIKWLTNKVKFRKDLLISTSYNLINNQIREFEAGFRQILGDTLSYFDTAPDKQGEQFFHVYTLGLLAVLSDDYIITSNRESGEGRYDIVLIPRDIKNNGIIIEIKQIKPQKSNEKAAEFSQRINDKIDEALEQIERKNYYKTLLAHKIELVRIKRVPIVFAGKEPYMLKLGKKKY